MLRIPDTQKCSEKIFKMSRRCGSWLIRRKSGPHIISTENGRQIFVMGHQEYDKGTLAGEYIQGR